MIGNDILTHLGLTLLQLYVALVMASLILRVVIHSLYRKVCQHSDGGGVGFRLVLLCADT